MKLAGKAALIVGGGTGLGRAIALLLANENCHVAVNYSRSRDEAVRTRDAVAAFGVKGLAVQADVTDAGQIRQMVQEVTRELGGIDIMVYSAGTTVHIPFPELDRVTEADWDRLMAVNLKGAFLCAQAVAPIMKQRQAGRIVMVASTSGIKPSGSSIPYSVAKAGLIMLSKDLAVALAPEILVNAVAPGMMRTRWWDGFPEEALQRIEQATLSKKAALVDDVAAAVLQMIKADSMTGNTVVIDGGVTMY